MAGWPTVSVHLLAVNVRNRVVKVHDLMVKVDSRTVKVHYRRVKFDFRIVGHHFVRVGGRVIAPKNSLSQARTGFCNVLCFLAF